MSIETVNEKIDVIAIFKKSQITPFKFRWQNREYKIKRINGKWTRREGQFQIYCFAVTTESEDYFEIAFSTQFMQWWLIRMDVC